MTTELKSTFIPADLHEWLRTLAFTRRTSIQAEVEKALREVYEQRTASGATNEQPAQPAAVAQ